MPEVRASPITATSCAPEIPVTAASPPTWHAALFNRRMLICIFIGFSSGLPLYIPVSYTHLTLPTNREV